MESTEKNRCPDAVGEVVNNDPLHQRILERLDTLGMTQREASRRVYALSHPDRDPATIRYKGLSLVGDILKKGSERPRMKSLVKLSQVLECSLDYLLGYTDKIAPVEGEEQSFAPKRLSARSPLRMINLYSSPLMPTSVWLPISTEAVDQLPVIPPLANVRNGYSYSISSKLMEPRYFIGETVYMNPGLAIRPDDFVLIANHQGEVTIAQLAAFEGDSIRFRHLSPGLEHTLSFTDLKHMHRIVSSAS